MGQRSTVLFVSGPAGSGKSFRRGPYFLLKEFLLTSEGKHISNFPLKFDPWTDGAGVEQPGLVKLAEEYCNLSAEVIRERVLCIDPEETKLWRNENFQPRAGEPQGPWVTFRDVDLSGVHLAIDEIHNYCGTHSSPLVKKAWQTWLGELRHRGATVEFLSQHEAKVDKVIQQEAEIRLELVPQEQRRDPLFGIQLYYWYNLWGKATGRWKPSVWVHEYRQGRGKWNEEHAERFFYDAKLFGAYDSWSTPVAGGRSGSTGKKEFQTHTWPGLLWWFFTANLQPLVMRAAAVSLVFLLFVFRSHLLAAYFGMFMSFGGVGKAPAQKAQPAAAVAGRAGQGIAPAIVKFEGQVVTPDKVFNLVERLDLVEEQAVRDREVIANQSERLAELKKRLEEAFAVSGISRSQVFFRAGCAYSIGEIIDWGPYNGLKVEGIDYGRRLVQLSGGRVLRMGVGDSGVSPADWLQGVAVESSAANLVPTAAPIPRSLPSAGDNTPKPKRSILAKSARNDLNSGDASGGVRPADGRSAPGLDRAGTIPRSAAGDSRTR